MSDLTDALEGFKWVEQRLIVPLTRAHEVLEAAMQAESRLPKLEADVAEYERRAEVALNAAVELEQAADAARMKHDVAKQACAHDFERVKIEARQKFDAYVHDLTLTQIAAKERHDDEMARMAEVLNTLIEEKAKLEGQVQALQRARDEAKAALGIA